MGLESDTPADDDKRHRFTTRFSNHFHCEFNCERECPCSLPNVAGVHCGSFSSLANRLRPLANAVSGAG